MLEVPVLSRHLGWRLVAPCWSDSGRHLLLGFVAAPLLVAAYGGQEVRRETLARTTLAAGTWRIVIPANATRPLERAGFK